MSQAQRVIKYIAIAFGLFLAINIICGIVFGVLGVFGFAFMNENSFSQKEVSHMDKSYEIKDNISSLKVNMNISELEIKTADFFKVEASNVTDQFKVSTANNTLNIQDENMKGKLFNWTNKVPKVTIYIPKNFEFNKVDIKTGVGITKIEELKTENLKLEIGVSNFFADKLISSNISRIQGGVGKVEIYRGDFYNLDLSTGVGESTIRAVLRGNNNIDCGIGKINFILEDSIDNYRINAKTGIGVIFLNGNKLSNESTFGTGSNTIKFNGGIGAVDISTK